jgi:hypothetical protein
MRVPIRPSHREADDFDCDLIVTNRCSGAEHAAVDVSALNARVGNAKASDGDPSSCLGYCVCGKCAQTGSSAWAATRTPPSRPSPNPAASASPASSPRPPRAEEPSSRPPLPAAAGRRFRLPAQRAPGSKQAKERKLPARSPEAAPAPIPISGGPSSYAAASASTSLPAPTATAAAASSPFSKTRSSSTRSSSPRPTQRAARSPIAAARRALLSRKQGPPNAAVAAVHESRRATTTPRPPEGAVSRTGTGLVPPQVPRRMPSRLRSPQAQGRQVAASTRLDLPSLTAPSVIGPCQETGRGACASGRGRANVQGARVIRRESRELLGALRRRSIYARSAFPRDPNT